MDKLARKNEINQKRSSKLKERSKTIQQKIDNIKLQQKLLTQRLNYNLNYKMNLAQRNKSKHLSILRIKARKSSHTIQSIYQHKQAIKHLRPVILKVKIRKLFNHELYQNYDLNFDKMVSLHQNEFFKLNESILSCLNLPNFTNFKIFNYSIFLIIDVYDSVKYHRHPGVNANFENNRNNKVINFLINILFKVAIELQINFHNLFNQPIKQILNECNEYRIKFYKTWSTFNYYFQILKHLHHQNFELTLEDGLSVVNKQLEIFDNDPQLLDHKKFLEGQRILKPNSITSCQLDVIEKLSEIPILNHHTFQRYDKSIFNSDKFPHSFIIRYNQFKFITPPNIPLNTWRLFNYDRFKKKKLQLKTGILNKDNSSRENMNYLHFITEKYSHITDVQHFINDFNTITFQKIQNNGSNDLFNQLKQTKIFPEELFTDPQIVNFEISLYHYWCSRYELSSVEFKILENILILLNYNKYSIKMGTNSPQLRLPKYYQFLHKNGFNHNFNDIVKLSIGSFSHINITDNYQQRSYQFYRSIYSHGLVYNNISENEIDTLIISKLNDIQLQLQCIICSNITFQLLKTFYGIVKYDVPNILSEDVLKKHSSQFNEYYKSNLSTDSLLYTTFQKKLCTIMTNTSSTQLLSTTFFVKQHELRKIINEFDHIINYHYEVYSPLLNWIYRDIGSPDCLS